MSEDRFFERLRSDAEQLRYQPRDEFAWTRLIARIREAVRRQPNVPQLLARWVRPITASFVMLALAAAMTITWIERAHESAYVTEAMSSNSLEISVDGDTFNLAE